MLRPEVIRIGWERGWFAWAAVAARRAVAAAGDVDGRRATRAIRTAAGEGDPAAAESNGGGGELSAERYNLYTTCIQLAI